MAFSRNEAEFGVCTLWTSPSTSPEAACSHTVSFCQAQSGGRWTPCVTRGSWAWLSLPGPGRCRHAVCGAPGQDGQETGSSVCVQPGPEVAMRLHARPWDPWPDPVWSLTPTPAGAPLGGHTSLPLVREPGTHPGPLGCSRASESWSAVGKAKLPFEFIFTEKVSWGHGGVQGERLRVPEGSGSPYFGCTEPRALVVERVCREKEVCHLHTHHQPVPSAKGHASHGGPSWALWLLSGTPGASFSGMWKKRKPRDRVVCVTPS